MLGFLDVSNVVFFQYLYVKGNGVEITTTFTTKQISTLSHTTTFYEDQAYSLCNNSSLDK